MVKVEILIKWQAQSAKNIIQGWEKSQYWQLFVSTVVVAIVILGFGISAVADSQLPRPTPLAQGSLVGECRTVNKQVSVYTQASTTSPAATTLNAETQVTLADNGSQGFIRISSPVDGYLQAVNLKPCVWVLESPTMRQSVGRPVRMK